MYSSVSAQRIVGGGYSGLAEGGCDSGGCCSRLIEECWVNFHVTGEGKERLLKAESDKSRSVGLATPVILLFGGD